MTFSNCTLVMLALVVAGCGSGAESPAAPTAGGGPARDSAAFDEILTLIPTTIGFSGLTVSGSPVDRYRESAFQVESMSGPWAVRTGYGSPAPFIQFSRLASEGTKIGEVEIRAGVGGFTFTSVDLYSSVTTIPYVFTGYRNSQVVFTVAGTVPNTFGNFATVQNPNSTSRIDTLRMRLSNPAVACCGNPMGIDTLRLVRLDPQ